MMYLLNQTSPGMRLIFIIAVALLAKKTAATQTMEALSDEIIASSDAARTPLAPCDSYTDSMYDDNTDIDSEPNLLPEPINRNREGVKTDAPVSKETQLFVKHIGAATYTLDVDRSDTILDCKRLLESKTKLPQKWLKLSFGGIPLKDDRTLQSYGINRCNTLWLTTDVIGMQRSGIFREKPVDSRSSDSTMILESLPEQGNLPQPAPPENATEETRTIPPRNANGTVPIVPTRTCTLRTKTA